MGIEYKGLVAQSLPKQIADQIGVAIMEGRLQANERLPTEDELAAKFNVSRATIREALKRLAAQNLIRSRRGPSGGTFVNQPTREETSLTVANATKLLVSMGEFTLEEIAEARLEIELACCRLAAQRRTEDDLAALLREITRQGESSLSDEDFCASDVAFHRALVVAAANAALHFAATGVIEALQPAINMVIFRYRNRRTVTALHMRIYRALKARDADAACAALREYIDGLQGQYRKARETALARAGIPSKPSKARERSSG